MNDNIATTNKNENELQMKIITYLNNLEESQFVMFIGSYNVWQEVFI